MTPRAKLALAGIAVAGGVAAYFASTGTAKASSIPSGPAATPKEPWPSDQMPWNIYSATTKRWQKEYNRRATEANEQGYAEGVTYDLFPLIEADGVVGVETCSAAIDMNLGMAVPVVCWAHTQAAS
jgi:hypothetical protein